MTAPDDADRWVHVLVTETLADDAVAAVVARFDDAIAADVAALTADRELRRDLHASNLAQARALLGWIAGDSDEVVPPPAAYELARTVARRGLPLKVLMQIYRAGQTVLVRHVAEVAADRVQDPILVPGIQIRLLERASRWISVSLEVLTDTYAEQRERDLRGDVARRVETVRAVVRGELLDDGVAATRLGHPTRTTHLALVAWVDGPGTTDLDTALREALPTGHRVLTVSAGSGAVWAWVSGDDVSADVVPDGVPGGVRIAVGAIGTGLDGFRRSHLEALRARAVAEAAPGAAAVVRYADVEIAYLLGGRPDAVGAFVDRELRGIDGTDAASDRLRRTVAAYLRHDRSLDAAARSLGVHRNTVRYRIRRAEEDLGRPIGGPGRLELELALAYRRVFSDPDHRS
ncbi:PucR family transcriptional regulator [Rhodococcoides corynebacterioides]|uniref:Helix-turn-helix domain-containing protein n=1 Tax=Rhodococcoides corynebacterioides TaxID=53972 RepID=A0ABS7NZC2_9NOCA|nr:helix-turn-helix domain-containing protein [Rhodococcus corynebacterioides]MBY6365479.1 helix-turn-helix domain-containing protein [Rhodococcus corynebacterioides]MBY6409452.1 helix-turn-helix domain-containing protein [Rhodococcus corynebacterioides]